MCTLPEAQSSTFYEALQQCKRLDLRDNRGKVHRVEVVLMGVLIGLCRNRDGVLSGIHRSMVNTHSLLCSYLKIENSSPISRAQLPVVLKKIDISAFCDLLFAFAGIVLSEQEKQWFAADGKELRGSIIKGEKRGEAVVQFVSHSHRQVNSQTFYNGCKESERPCIQQLLQVRKLCSQKITLDALHLIPETIRQIAGGQGIYVAGLKDNQQLLYEDMTSLCKTLQPVRVLKEVQKGHGRIEKRTYKGYSIADEYFDQRWEGADFRTLIEIERIRRQAKTGVESKQVAYYLSNAPIKDSKEEELFKAVRGHWNIETSNHLRDVTLKEDQLKTKEPAIARVLACCRTVVLNVLNKLKLKNIKAKLETFADNFELLMKWMTLMNFL